MEVGGVWEVASWRQTGSSCFASVLSATRYGHTCCDDKRFVWQTHNALIHIIACFVFFLFLTKLNYLSRHIKFSKSTKSCWSAGVVSLRGPLACGLFLPECVIRFGIPDQPGARISHSTISSSISSRSSKEAYLLRPRGDWSLVCVILMCLLPGRFAETRSKRELVLILFSSELFIFRLISNEARFIAFHSVL